MGEYKNYSINMSKNFLCYRLGGFVQQKS